MTRQRYMWGILYYFLGPFSAARAGREARTSAGAPDPATYGRALLGSALVRAAALDMVDDQWRTSERWLRAVLSAVLAVEVFLVRVSGVPVMFPVLGCGVFGRQGRRCCGGRITVWWLVDLDKGRRADLFRAPKV